MSFTLYLCVRECRHVSFSMCFCPNSNTIILSFNIHCCLLNVLVSIKFISFNIFLRWCTVMLISVYQDIPSTTHFIALKMWCPNSNFFVPTVTILILSNKTYHTRQYKLWFNDLQKPFAILNLFYHDGADQHWYLYIYLCTLIDHVFLAGFFLITFKYFSANIFCLRYKHLFIVQTLRHINQ